MCGSTCVVVKFLILQIIWCDLRGRRSPRLYFYCCACRMQHACLLPNEWLPSVISSFTSRMAARRLSQMLHTSCDMLTAGHRALRQLRATSCELSAIQRSTGVTSTSYSATAPHAASWRVPDHSLRHRCTAVCARKAADANKACSSGSNANAWTASTHLSSSTAQANDKRSREYTGYLTVYFICFTRQHEHLRRMPHDGRSGVRRRAQAPAGDALRLQPRRRRQAQRSWTYRSASYGNECDSLHFICRRHRQTL